MNTYTLNFKVKGQTLSPATRNAVADSQGYLKARFEFSEDWNGVTKYVQFKRDDLFFDVALDNNNECEIPWETMVDEGVILVTVYAMNSSPNKLITANPAEVILQRSGLAADQLPKQPTPGLLGSALQDALDSIEETKEDALEDLQDAIDAAAATAAETTAEQIRETLAGYVTDTSNNKDAAAASATLAANWANKTDDVVSGNEYSAKYYAMRAKTSADNAAAAAETAAADAAETAAAAAAETAADAAATAVASEIAADKTAAQTAASAAEAAETDAENFAVSETAFTKATDLEDETEYYSAKHYADAAAAAAETVSEGATTATTAAAAAQDWATLMGETVGDTDEYSAKHYARQAGISASNASTAAGNAELYAGYANNYLQGAETQASLAQDWATKTDGTVGTTEEYSAKHYAQAAATSLAAIEESAASAAQTAAQAAATAAASAAAQTAAELAAPAAAEAVRSELAGYVTSTTNSKNAAADYATDAQNFAVAASAFTKESGSDHTTEYHSAKYYADQLENANPVTGVSISGTTVTISFFDGTSDDTISTQDTTYTAGNGIEIDSQNSNAVKVKAGTNVTVDSSGVSVSGSGSVASGNTGLISGGTLYTEGRVSSNGNYVLAANTIAQNLSALDTQAKANADAIGTNSSDGNYIKKSATKNVSENLTLLDTQTKANTDAIGTLAADGNYIKKSATKNVCENLDILDTNLKAITDDKAESDAGNVGVNASTDNSEDWGDAIGGGTVASGNKKLVTGGTVFTETRTTSDGNYTLAANTAAQNIAALDGQVKTNADAISTETTNRGNAIGTISADGNYIKKSTDKNVSENMGILDGQVKSVTDDVATVKGRPYMAYDNNGHLRVYYNRSSS